MDEDIRNQENFEEELEEKRQNCKDISKKIIEFLVQFMPGSSYALPLEFNGKRNFTYAPYFICSFMLAGILLSYVGVKIFSSLGKLQSVVSRATMYSNNTYYLNEFYSISLEEPNDPEGI